MADPAAAPSPWTARRLWWFRFGFAWFVLQFIDSALDTSPGARSLGNALYEAARATGAAISPAIIAAIERFAAQSDGHAVVLSLLRDGLLALLIASVWTAIDRRRQHERGARQLRVVIRYLVGTVMLVYGGMKLVPVQFQPPPAEHMLLRLGDHSPMSLLWATIGISPAYTIFGGIGESVGGMLLFWRRTTTLGALLVAAVMTNVVMLNFCYDIPVKRGAAQLLLAALVLAARDRRALWAVLWRRQAGSPEPEPPWAGGAFTRRLRGVLKPLWVAAAALGPMIAALVLGRRPETGPLHGVHRVERVVVASTEAPFAPERWRILWLGDRGGAVVQTEDGRIQRYQFVIDPATSILTLSPTNGPAIRFGWSRTGGRLHLQDLDAAERTIELRSMPAAEAFRLLR